MVRAKLSAWCSHGNYQRDTAARVYASGLEQSVLAWSMFDLARIAANKMQCGRHAVAEAVNQLYRPERADWILTDLYGWSQAPLVQVHAARALIALARRADPEAPDGRPELLTRLVERRVTMAHLARLWTVAFLEPSTAAEAAHSLARWIGHADAKPELRPYAVELLQKTAATPAMGRRISFYLTRSPELRNGLPEWARA